MIQRIQELVAPFLPSGAPLVIEIPTELKFGHYSTGVALKLGKELKKSPLAIAEELRDKLVAAHGDFFEKIEVAPPGFVNFWLSKDVLYEELVLVSREKSDYGRSAIGKGQTVIVEYSDPNIAKRMHVGHLRATIIGDAIANIHSFLGYKVIRWNYLGDWGTQFGKMIAAYKLWGKKEEVKKNPIESLQALYVKFHEKMKKQPELENRGREEFRKLETGNAENRKLWEWFKKESLKEFDKIYKTLGVHFDVEIGESFYEKDLIPLVQDLVSRGFAKTSEGSIIVPLDSQSLPPALVQKSDGGSLYLTRDIANIAYRLKKYHPAKILYVVGNEQSLHFEQLFAVARLIGMELPVVAHLKYGLVLGKDSKKLATREGKTILLEDVIRKVIELARGIVEEKNPELSGVEKNKVAAAVGVGALKYNDLKENRHSDIVFDWERMLSLEGNSAPYLLYTYTRLTSILRKAKVGKFDPRRLEKPLDFELVLKLIQFPDVIQKVALTYFPHFLAEYLYGLAKTINYFYQTEPVLKAPDGIREARLGLIRSLGYVMETGLGLLGINVVSRM